MPDLDHTALEAAARAATQGEWRAGGVRGTIVGALDQNGTWLDAVADVESGPHDAAYIVAAQPSVILALLEERKRLVERVESMKRTTARLLGEAEARATAVEAERDRMRAALEEIDKRDCAFLKTPSGKPEPGYPGYMGAVARAALAGEKEPKP